MGLLFGSSNQFEEPLNKLTNEINTETDWAALLELCDKVSTSSKGPQDFCNAIFSKLNNKVPHVSMQAMTVLDACVKNCGKEFHKEMASQSFTESVREFLYTYKNPTVINRMKYLVRKWAEEFKNDPTLAHFVSIYYYLRGEGIDFPETDEYDTPKKPSQPLTTNPDAVSSQQEADDIAKAIEASLKEEQEKNKRKGASSLYPSMQDEVKQSAASSTATSNVSSGGKRKVKALYDFEAAEDNELTFHTGDVIMILDDSDVNWWKGEGSNGVGLFPANFVTAELDAKSDVETSNKVSFNESVEVKEITNNSDVVIKVDEALIDKTLLTLQNTDPETQATDDPQLLQDEEMCKKMESLIDTKLQRIDREHLDLTMLNEKILESLKMYDTLMKDLPVYGGPQILGSPSSGMVMPGHNLPMTGYMSYQTQQYPAMHIDNTQIPNGMMPGMMQNQLSTQYMYPQMVANQQPNTQQQHQEPLQGYNNQPYTAVNSSHQNGQIISTQSSTTNTAYDNNTATSSGPFPTGLPSNPIIGGQMYQQNQNARNL